MANNNPTPNKPDLDLIQMVQQARMKNDDTATPSNFAAVYWIEAKAPNPQPTPRAGAWVISTTVQEIDALWATIKKATENDELGYKSKASTSPGKRQGRNSDRLIHVRVADSDDTAAVERIGEKLRELGVDAEAMEYQRDKDS